MYRSNRSFNIPPGHTLGIWHLCRPGEKGILLSESSSGWGIWFPCIRGGEFELHPRFHVKSLAWQAIMGDAVLEDFVEKIVRVVANWLRGEGLNKLCTVFEGIQILIFLILDSGFAGVSNRLLMLINKVSDDTCQWNGHDVVISLNRWVFFHIKRFVCCMSHEEKLSIQWPCSSAFRRFARDFCSW